MWLGIHRRTTQYVIFDVEEGIRNARTVIRYPHPQKFSVEIAQKVKIGPPQLHVHVPRKAVFRDCVTEPLQHAPTRSHHCAGFMRDLLTLRLLAIATGAHVVNTTLDMGMAGQA